jgi:uncharacterized membrane protein
MSVPPVVRPRLGLLAALLLASLTSTLLVAARVVRTGRLTFAFLDGNLVLAWIPLGFALLAHAASERRSWPVASERRSWRAALVTTAALAGWLLFFPNAPYMVTDLMHLRVERNPLFWLDLVTLQAFAWTGLALGFVSLDLVQRIVARRAGEIASWVFAAAAIGLSAFGVYLGRFRRWNSWDVARDPFGLVSDLARMLLHPFAHVQVMAFSVVLGAFLLTAYVVVRSFPGSVRSSDGSLRRHP